MANMAYCRFCNTNQGLGECLENIDAQLSDVEHEARQQLVRKCALILISLGVPVDEQDLSDAIADADSFQ